MSLALNDTAFAQFRPVEGRVFPESFLLLAGEVLLGTFVLGPLGVLLMLAWWNEWSLADRRISLAGALLGALLAGVGFLSLLLLGKVYRRESLIIGKDYFQVVVGADKVTQQIPYRNIAKLSLMRGHENPNLIRGFIGIDLANTKDSETWCPAAETSMKLHGWHCRIEPGLRPVPLEQLYELIMIQMPPRSRPDTSSQ